MASLSRPAALIASPAAVLVAAFLVGAVLLGAGAAQAMNEPSKPFSFRFATCRDQEVGRFIGQDKSVALAEMRTGRFRLFRLLSYQTLVNFEVEPDRLTLVVNDDGQVISALSAVDLTGQARQMSYIVSYAWGVILA